MPEPARDARRSLERALERALECARLRRIHRTADSQVHEIARASPSRQRGTQLALGRFWTNGRAPLWLWRNGSKLWRRDACVGSPRSLLLRRVLRVVRTLLTLGRLHCFFSAFRSMVQNKRAAPRPSAHEDRIGALREQLGTLLLKCRVDRADADDIAQDIALDLFMRVRQISEFAPAHLFRYARRAALRRRSKVLRRIANRSLREGIWCSFELRTPRDPLLELESRRALLAFQAHLASLTESLREPVILCDVEGLTCERAAALLGIRPGTLKTRLRKGRAMLRTLRRRST